MNVGVPNFKAATTAEIIMKGLFLSLVGPLARKTSTELIDSLNGGFFLGDQSQLGRVNQALVPDIKRHYL